MYPRTMSIVCAALWACLAFSGCSKPGTHHHTVDPVPNMAGHYTGQADVFENGQRQRTIRISAQIVQERLEDSASVMDLVARITPQGVVHIDHWEERPVLPDWLVWYEFWAVGEIDGSAGWIDYGQASYQEDKKLQSVAGRWEIREFTASPNPYH